MSDNILLQECIDALSSKIVFTETQSDLELSELHQLIHFTSFGHIDENSNKTILLENLSEVKMHFSNDDKILLIWNTKGLPIIETTFLDFYNVSDDVLAVYYDTFIWNKMKQKIAEIRSNGDIYLFSY